jgi:hypothetical protein
MAHVSGLYAGCRSNPSGRRELQDELSQRDAAIQGYTRTALIPRRSCMGIRSDNLRLRHKLEMVEQAVLDNRVYQSELMADLNTTRRAEYAARAPSNLPAKPPADH